MKSNRSVCLEFRELSRDPIDLGMSPTTYPCDRSRAEGEEYEFYAEYVDPIRDGEMRSHVADMLSSCKKASCRLTDVHKEVAKLIDVGIPCTNAFCKMFEICRETEFGALIRSYVTAGVAIELACLAEFPGAFLIAMAYFSGLICLDYLDKGLFHYVCTTLDPASTKQEALKDMFSLQARNPGKWHYMDLTSVEQIKEKMRAMGEGLYDIVTGDIGKDFEGPGETDTEMYLEELGQFIMALGLLKDGGCACLKMFSGRKAGQVSMLRYAQGLFRKCRLFKPLTSHDSNHETYWVLSGFKRSLSEDHFSEMLEVLRMGVERKSHYDCQLSSSPTSPAPQDAEALTYPPFIRDVVGKDLLVAVVEMERKVRRERECVVHAAVECMLYLDTWNMRTTEAYKTQLNWTYRMRKGCIGEWIDLYPIRRLGKPIYKLLNFPMPTAAPSQTSPPASQHPHSSGRLCAPSEKENRDSL